MARVQKECFKLPAGRLGIIKVAEAASITQHPLYLLNKPNRCLGQCLVLWWQSRLWNLQMDRSFDLTTDRMVNQTIHQTDEH